MFRITDILAMLVVKHAGVGLVELFIIQFILLLDLEDKKDYLNHSDAITHN